MFLVSLFIAAALTGAQPSPTYDYDKKYSITQLKEDFIIFRNILESNHPRLYEFTPKNEYDIFLDSLYQSIDKEMTEREYQYFLAQAVAKVKCSHTKLLPSKYLSDHFDEFLKAPPFKLFIKENKAYMWQIYSTGSSIVPGAEVFSINGIPIKELVDNYEKRIPQEGHNRTFIYYQMNTPIQGLFPGICDYPNIQDYTLRYKNPGTCSLMEISLKPISFNKYPPMQDAKIKRPINLIIMPDQNTAILSISTFKIKTDADYYFREYLTNTFKELKNKKVANLIIDLRGNIGGWPTNANALLRFIMKKSFTLFKREAGWDQFISPTQLDKNRFTGNLYFLSNGACRSCTGFVLSFVKYHKLGPIIGEESCGSASCNDGHSDYKLPNTKLVLQCPNYIYDIPIRSFTHGYGIAPDYEVKANIGDLLSNRDVVLQSALDMISRHSATMKPNNRL